MVVALLLLTSRQVVLLKGALRESVAPMFRFEVEVAGRLDRVLVVCC